MGSPQATVNDGKAARPALDVLPAVYRLRPWYHDFAPLGLRTDFEDLSAPAVHRARRVLSEVRRALMTPHATRRFSLRGALQPPPSSHRLNQRVKEPVLTRMMTDALRAVPKVPRCLDLFCADGYYSCVLAHTRPDAFVIGVDADPRQIERARTAAGLLDYRGAAFVSDDVTAFLQRDGLPYDVILCAGGLYHLGEPRRLLELLRRRRTHFLIVQSVVTLETEDPDYFARPALGWRHGSRFTHAALKRWLLELGWIVLAEERNDLPGNARLEDRGSSYFLCRGAGSQ